MMKKPKARPRAALLIGAAFLATPAFAQDVPAPPPTVAPPQQTVTPPPIMVTPPAQPTPQRVIEVQPPSPVVQAIPAEPEPAAEQPAARRTETRTVTRQAPARQARVETPAPAADPAPAAPAAETAPLAETPAPLAQAPVTEPAPAAPVAETPVATETESAPGLSWPLMLGGLLLVIAGLAAFLMMRRKGRDEAYAEPAYAEAPETLAAEPAIIAPEPEIVMPVAAAAPVVVAPQPEEAREPHEEVELAEAETADLAGVTDAPAPVANRPWLEFGMRPVRAGTSEEEALVDVELTVGNAGDTPAKDVRISTFMLADADASEMENLLMERRSDTTVPPVTIAPGDGTRVDAHLAVPKGELGRTFNPVVVAEARYTLPDGREGRTSAAFKIGRPAFEGGLGAIGSSRPHMVDNVEAELFGTPEHA